MRITQEKQEWCLHSNKYINTVQNGGDFFPDTSAFHFDVELCSVYSQLGNAPHMHLFLWSLISSLVSLVETFGFLSDALYVGWVFC